MAKKKAAKAPVKRERHMAHRTITLTHVLNERLSEVKDVNWSAVAVTAFEAKLGELAMQKAEKSMKDVADRLRKSLNENQDARFKEGFECGKEWAQDKAEAVELQRLEALVDNPQKYEDIVENPGSNAYSASELLASEIVSGEGLMDRSEFRQFWMSVRRR